MVYEGEVDPPARWQARRPLLEIRGTENLDRTIQVHAIQVISVTAADAVDGDRAIPAKGGTVTAMVEHANLVAGYRYTLSGQLLTPSGQSAGLLSSVAECIRGDNNGSLTMEFSVPTGFEGLRFVPVIGLYHQSRVTLNEDGSVTPIPDAPNPIMIASDLSRDPDVQTVEIGVPFEKALVTDQKP